MAGVNIKNRQLVYKSLTDPAYRKLLLESPEKALNVKTLTPDKLAMVKKMVERIKIIENDISHVADELLCANGGPCGIG